MDEIMKIIDQRKDCRAAIDIVIAVLEVWKRDKGI